jgi:hypothetical protein
MQFVKGFLIIVIICGISSATSVRAVAVSAAETESALKQADQKLAAKEKAAPRFCWNSGSPNKTRQQSIHCSAARTKRQKLRRQRAEVQRMLDELEAGRSVDPAAVDRVLREAGVSAP